MKLFEKHAVKLVRIQFGHHKSITFQDTDVETVFDIFKKVFSEVKVDKTIKLKDFCPMQKFADQIALRINAREEFGSIKGRSKNRTIYGLTDDEAMQIFLDNYEKHL